MTKDEEDETGKGESKRAISLPAKFIGGDSFAIETAESMVHFLDVSSVIITYNKNGIWMRSIAGMEVTNTDIPNGLHHTVSRERAFLEIEDCLTHPSYKFINLKTDSPIIRSIACYPIVNTEGTILGSITLLDQKKKKRTSSQIAAIGQCANFISSNLTCRGQNYPRRELTLQKLHPPSKEL